MAATFQTRLLHPPSEASLSARFRSSPVASPWPRNLAIVFNMAAIQALNPIDAVSKRVGRVPM